MLDEADRYAKSGAFDLVPGSSVHLIAEQIHAGEKILDVGCGSGEIGAVLVSRGGIVDGVEMDPSRAEVARSRLRSVVTGMAGAPDLDDSALDTTYDTVMFIDVIEHIAYPRKTLTWARERLVPGGRILAMIPNSAHLEFRWRMLKGDWRYEDDGLFDRDHVRFYDPDTMRQIPEQAGMVETNRWYRGKFKPWMRGRERLLNSFPRSLASSVLVEWREPD